MKKFLLLFAFIGISFLGYGQDVKVNINNQDVTTKDDCPYRINGVCVTEDIGGVDAKFIDTCLGCNTYKPALILTNYNLFAVNVLWSVQHGNVIQNGVIVLGAEAEKTINLPSGVSPRDFSINGLIVRKLAK